MVCWSDWYYLIFRLVGINQKEVSTLQNITLAQIKVFHISIHYWISSLCVSVCQYLSFSVSLPGKLKRRGPKEAPLLPKICFIIAKKTLPKFTMSCYDVMILIQCLKNRIEIIIYFTFQVWYRLLWKWIHKFPIYRMKLKYSEPLNLAGFLKNCYDAIWNDVSVNKMTH